MFRRFFQLFLRSPQAPAPVDPSADHVVLYATVQDAPRSRRRTAHRTAPPHARQIAPPQATHRERLLSMKLEHTKLCSPHRCQRLAELGIVTAGDLAAINPQLLAERFAAPRKAVSVIKRYRRAIRLAAAVPGMMPRDAMLLVSIHRRSVRGLASETPSALHRDLERYAQSTKGRLQLRGRRVPSTRRLKRWISQCESLSLRAPLQTRVA